MMALTLKRKLQARDKSLVASQKLFLWAHLEWNRQDSESVGWSGNESGRRKSLASGNQTHCGSICSSWPWSISVGESNSFLCNVSKPLPFPKHCQNECPCLYHYSPCNSLQLLPPWAGLIKMTRRQKVLYISQLF